MMKKEDLRIVFMGTPEFAVATLKALVDNGYNVVAVITQPDKPVGRHQVLTPPAVKVYAMEKGIPVLQPEKMKDPTFLETLSAYHADLQVVVAFRMLPEVVWAMPRYGTFNVHASLLPQYRGAAPINWAIINGEEVTGITTFFLDHEIDTGRIIMQEPFSIPDDADVEYVYDGLMNLGAEVCLRTIERIVKTDGQPKTISQKEMNESDVPIKTAPKIFKDTCCIDWNKRAKQVYDFIRGLSPMPGAWTTLIVQEGRESVLKIYKAAKCEREDGESMKHDAPRHTNKPTPGTMLVEGKHLYIQCIDAPLEILELQPSGKRKMNSHDYINGIQVNKKSRR